MGLTTIANRLTPSVPIQITFASQPVATGVKYAILIGHMASSGATATPYQVYQVQNVGDAAAAFAEVEALGGAGAQIAEMAQAFVAANANGNGPGNFPNFKVVFLPFSESSFGPNSEVFTALNSVRSDMLVSCYPASNSANATKLINFAVQISGIDRDLSGQFGSFVVLGSLDSATVQEAYDLNSQYAIVAGLPDSNTALVPIIGSTDGVTADITAISQAALTPTANLVSGNPTVNNVSSVAGIYPGASVTGTFIPSNTIVEQIIGTSLVLSNAPTNNATAETLTITNLPTAGVYPGALITGTGIPANATIISVSAASLVISAPTTSANTGEMISVQNQVSQAPEIVACDQAAIMLGSVFPYNPLQGIYGNLTPPQKVSDWVIFDPTGTSEALLEAGISPYAIQNSKVAVVRTRTTWLMNGEVPVTAYFDWQDLVTLNDFREDVFLICENPPFNNNPGGTKASQFTANLLKDEILREAQSYEDQGAFQAVQTLAPQFLVSPSLTSRGRFDFQIPVNVLPGLFVIAGNIQATTQFNFTL
jgi:hypothetical protein